MGGNELLCLLIFAPSTLAAEPKFPTLTGRVVDDAGVLSAATQSQLTDMLAAHERATGQQVVVVTLDSLQGFTIEDFGYQLGRHWGIGQKGTNTGALLIVAPKEHKVRIEVGYGLEGTLTDAQSRIIIEQSILPSFRSGDFNTGILNGTQAIIQVLGGNPLTDRSRAGRNWRRFRGGFSSSGACSSLVRGEFSFSIGCAITMTRCGRRNIELRSSVSAAAADGPADLRAGVEEEAADGGGFSGGGGSFGGGGASGSW